MSIYLPSTGGKEPYWGVQTSHMNFCEEDYHVTSYIGEFINTLSSLFYTYLGVRAIVQSRGRGEKGHLSWLSYMGIITLGIASALFHLTLKYNMQLLDDNSMLFGCGIMLYRLFTFQRSSTYKLCLAVLIFTGVCTAIWAHIHLGESTLHQVVFAFMMLTNAFRTSRTITKTVKDEEERWQMRKVGVLALGLFITGYGLWNIDNRACEQLRGIRHSIGLPWAWLLELHGWWHILTGCGVYLHTVMVECLCPRSPLQDVPLQQRFPWLANVGLGIRKKKA